MKTKYSSGIARGGTRNLLMLFALLGLCATTPSVSRGATLSELLEQGIYAEQTKGDLDGAVQSYQQIIKEAKAGEALAAQAQYRLGVCYYKKKDYTAATAAFDKLVHDYPDQKELCRLANEYLTGANVLQPVPWVDGEDLRLNVSFASGLKIGVANYTANADESNGRKIWRLSSLLYAAGVLQSSRVEVEADAFKPIHCLWKHSLLGTAETAYSPGHAELKLKNATAPKSVDVEGLVYDNEEVLQMMRRLPLSSNYTANIRVFSGLGGGAIIPLKLDVTGPEKVTVPAGTFDCFKVDLNINQAFWYSADEHRYLVKFEGGGVVAELTSVQQHKRGESTSFQDTAQGVSLALPWGWIVDRDAKVDAPGKAAFLMLDPDGTAAVHLNLRAVKDLKPEAQSSVRAWADSMVTDGGKVMKGFSIRQDSWKEWQISGRPAASVVADFTDGQEKKIAYGTYIIGDRDASEFWFTIAAADYESFRPKFDAIVNSYTSK